MTSVAETMLRLMSSVSCGAALIRSCRLAPDVVAINSEAGDVVGGGVNRIRRQQREWAVQSFEAVQGRGHSARGSTPTERPPLRLHVQGAGPHAAGARRRRAVDKAQAFASSVASTSSKRRARASATSTGRFVIDDIAFSAGGRHRPRPTPAASRRRRAGGSRACATTRGSRRRLRGDFRSTRLCDAAGPWPHHRTSLPRGRSPSCALRSRHRRDDVTVCRSGFVFAAMDGRCSGGGRRPPSRSSSQSHVARRYARAPRRNGDPAAPAGRGRYLVTSGQTSNRRPTASGR